jgi:hypothetical protein
MRIKMKRYLAMVVLIVLSSVVSSLAVTSSFAQDAPQYSEEYMQQHDGGDRAEYLQEMEYSDPWFYVPPVSDANFTTIINHTPLK